MGDWSSDCCVWCAHVSSQQGLESVSTPSSLTAASELARRLVAADTANPPGNEEEAQEHVGSFLESAGIPFERYEAERGRPNLVARLAGAGERPALVLHGHVDVVGVDGQSWQHPPFEAVVADGILHGRGTLDNKSGVAMLTHAFARAKIEGLEPSGDIVLVSAADSETGASTGLAYLLDAHPEIFDGARFAIGEFGGFPLHGLGKNLYRIGVGLKRYAHVRLTLHGSGGHGSQPVSGTIIGRLGVMLQQLDQMRMPHHTTPVARKTVEAIATAVDDGDRLLRLLDPEQFDETLEWLGPQRATFEAMFVDTANPTIVSAGAKFNVIPSLAEVELDCRLLPGRTVDDVVGALRDTVGPEVDIEVLDIGAPSPDDFDDTLLPLLGNVLISLDPTAVPVPFLFSESPDGRLFDAHGIQHYGFLPMNLPPDIDLPDIIHGPDERVLLDAIDFGADAIHRLLALY